MKKPEFYRGREQTYIKHFFLEKYLERVAYNILSFCDDFIYVDAFSGPWRAEDRDLEDTSFVIALNQLRNVRKGIKDRRGRDVRIRCLFNDSDRNAYGHLSRIAREVRDIEVRPLCRDFEDVIPEIVDYVGRSFSLTFIDPTGWKGFGLQKIQPLLALPGEVIINFMFDFVNRFLEDPRPEIAESFDPTFGGPGWDEEVQRRVDSGWNREDAILHVYRERLRQFGQFRHVTSTRIMKPTSDRSYFYLVYGTRHWKGLVEFRDIEKRVIGEQERVREAARLIDHESSTGQADLFEPSVETAGTRSFVANFQKQHDSGERRLREILMERRECIYEELLGTILEMSLVSESDVKKWIGEMRALGQVEMPDLGERERTPKPGHRIRWKS